MTSIDDSCLFNLPKKVSQSWIVEFSYCLIFLFISVGISEFTLYLCFKTMSSCKNFQVKMSLIGMKGNSFSSVWMVSHEASFWHGQKTTGLLFLFTITCWSVGICEQKFADRHSLEKALIISNNYSSRSLCFAERKPRVQVWEWNVRAWWRMRLRDTRGKHFHLIRA